MNERLNGARIACESFRREGVEVVFGFQGGAVIPLYDALCNYPDIHHVLVRNEAGAAFAACGYAQASRKVGVCIATSGPGATNLVTGIANANLDSLPLVAITGQVARRLIGTGAFQEVDITGIVLPITKWCNLVGKTEELAPTIKKAFALASTGRPGPVLLDIPVDVFRDEVEFEYSAQEPDIPGYWPQQMRKEDRVFIIRREINKAIKLIGQSKRPVIIAGNGIRIAGAYEEFKEFVDKMQTAVVSTLHGLAVFPQDDPLAFGMIGMHGTSLANMAVSEADLIIAIGMRFDDRATATKTGLAGFAPKARIIHIDIDPAEIGKIVWANVAIAGDAKVILQLLNSRISSQTHLEWLSQLEQWRGEYPANQEKESEQLLPESCIKYIADITGGEATIVADVGQNEMWTAQQRGFFTRPDKFIASGGLGPMGYWTAAIGAQFARPREKVWAIVGDGGLQMTIQELATVVQENLPIKIAVINNGFLGMVRQWQNITCEGRHTATRLPGPDFVKIS